MSIEKLTDAVGEINDHVKKATDAAAPINRDFVIDRVIDAVNAIHAIELDRLTQHVKADGEQDPAQA